MSVAKRAIITDCHFRPAVCIRFMSAPMAASCIFILMWRRPMMAATITLMTMMTMMITSVEVVEEGPFWMQRLCRRNNRDENFLERLLSHYLLAVFVDVNTRNHSPFPSQPLAVNSFGTSKRGYVIFSSVLEKALFVYSTAFLTTLDVNAVVIS